MSEIKLSVKELNVIVEELENLVCELWEKNYDLCKVEVKGMSRKDMLFSVLKSGGLWSVKELSIKMGEKVGKEISSRNVSSLLSYIRDDLEKGERKGSLVRVGRGVGKLKYIEE